jgi:hypothetical protein
LVRKAYYEYISGPRFGRFYVQRSDLSKQSHKPKLQSRFPSGPTGQFLTFLLPPTCIGAVPYRAQKHDIASDV